MIPTDRLYLKNHIWLKPEEQLLTIGITMQNITGDVIDVVLPALGLLTKGAVFLKIRHDVQTTSFTLPLKGTIAFTNAHLMEMPETLNQDPYEEGWILKLQPESAQPRQVLSAEEYLNYLEK